MASPKDIPTERPSSHHGPTAVPIASSMPSRQSASRQHSHSVSLGAFNPDHRITRRKSVNTNSLSTTGALRAALNGLDEATPRSAHRRSLTSRGSTNAKSSENGADNQAGSVSGQPFSSTDESAIADEMGPGQQNGNTKARARRASEGSHLNGKRANGELKCEKCGKGYKHSSCLTKHLWEHTPEWALTSKLLISKHQQVQLLEAASVLVGMNQDVPAELDPVKGPESDNSSASPAASGSSGLPDDDEYSSAETTPPPMADQYGMPEGVNYHRSKRYSGNSSSFSRSYQSAPSSSFPSAQGFAGMSALSPSSRPGTSGFNGLSSSQIDEDEASLVAAVQSLCSFGTPRNGPVLLPPDVPPVPPLPAQFAEKGLQFAKAPIGHQEPIGGTVTVHEVSDKDIEMEDHHNPGSYEERPGSGYDEADEGVFGGMEGLAHEAHETLSNVRAS